MKLTKIAANFPILILGQIYSTTDTAYKLIKSIKFKI